MYYVLMKQTHLEKWFIIIDELRCVVMLNCGLILLILKYSCWRRSLSNVEDVISLIGFSCKSIWINLVLSLKKDSIKCSFSSNNPLKVLWFKNELILVSNKIFQSGLLNWWARSRFSIQFLWARSHPC